MAFYSGNGGGITIGGGSEQNVGKWEVNSNARLVENTHSGTSGSKRARAAWSPVRTAFTSVYFRPVKPCTSCWLWVARPKRSNQ